jgi:dihydropyrimidine dehydrogenase (NAD+) subunit PreA
MELPSLSTEFVGITFSNPFIVASCPLTSDSSHILAAAKAGWGGAVTKTITAHPQYSRNLTPSLSIIRGKREVIGLGNNEVRTHLSLSEWCQTEIPNIKADAPPEFVLIGSIMEGTNPDDWGHTASRLEAAGVDIIEMNVSCAHGMPEKYMGAFINDDPGLLETVIAGCKAGANIPVVVKLNALSRDLIGAVNACVRGGADGVTATNTLLTLPSVDIHRRAPNQLAATQSYSTFMGYSGSGIRPFGLYAVAQINQHSSLPTSGIGGIESWENCVEYILLGAATVQVCTAAMLHGLDMVQGFKAGLAQYLTEHENMGTAEIRGTALSYLLTPEAALEASSLTKASVTDSKCTLCNKCINPCIEGATSAISLKGGKIFIDQDTCIGCGLCIAACPFDAISI